MSWHLGRTWSSWSWVQAGLRGCPAIRSVKSSLGGIEATNADSRAVSVGYMGRDPSLEASAELRRLAEGHGWLLDEWARSEDGVWVVDGGYPSSVYEPGLQAALDEVVESSWWYLIRNSLLVDYIHRFGTPRAMWEVGSGTGIVAEALTSAGISTVAIEPSRVGARAGATRGLTSIASTLEDLHLPTKSLPAIGLFDVLEHLQEPEELLTECHRVLERLGLLYLSVPAFSWLWSRADELAGHKRRYTKKTLTKLLRDCGFEVHNCSYSLATLIAPMAIFRSLPWRLGYRSDEKVIVKQLGYLPEAIARSILCVERRLVGFVPVGTSLFASVSPL